MSRLWAHIEQKVKRTILFKNRQFALCTWEEAHVEKHLNLFKTTKFPRVTKFWVSSCQPTFGRYSQLLTNKIFSSFNKMSVTWTEPLTCKMKRWNFLKILECFSAFGHMFAGWNMQHPKNIIHLTSLDVVYVLALVSWSYFSLLVKDVIALIFNTTIESCFERDFFTKETLFFPVLNPMLNKWLYCYCK